MYRDFIFILSSYKCNKNCPYCIAKMGSLNEEKDNLNRLKEELVNLKKNGIKFEYFVLSGNGEPSLYNYNFLMKLKNMVEKIGIFADFRVQTSGNLFYEKDKWNLFKDWLIEITRVNKEYFIDKDILNYEGDYIETELFNKSRIRLNIVLLKSNFNSLDETIKYYFDETHNIETIALKILDTFKDKSDRKEYEWIEDNGIKYSDIDYITDYLNNHFEFKKYSFNNYIWSYKSKVVSMYYKKTEEKNNIIFYGEKVLN